MKTFENVKFKGTFRDYQARVLDNLEKYFHDKKVNIVAAPGSGKTILGLEIIRKLGSACLVFSPTTTIRNQWGDRFEEMFLPENENIDDYVSFDLFNVKPVTSVTYQALYSAMKKVKTKTEDEEVDYSNVDLFKLITENNIKTICLDEAHHLQNEWQKALDTFVKGLGKDIKIISLTATPPYDATPAEWKRYSEICGEIDEEIFVPELVGRKNLCPHQDYIYFNFPTKEEVKEFSGYKQNVADSLEAVKNLDFIQSLPEKIQKLFNSGCEEIYSNVKGYVAVLVLLDHYKLEVNQKIVKALTTKKLLPSFNLEFAEIALEHLLESPEILEETQKEQLEKLLKTFGVIDKNQVELSLNASLKRKFISSMGKLESIKKIAKCEIESLGEKLHMLILTDYIKKENTKTIGTDQKFNSISVVSIFETLRKENLNAKLAVLSGTLIILPNELANELKKDAKIKLSAEKIAETAYSIVNLKASNREKVNLIGRLFESGKIQILIGTKALLGEGWDSPCINSLILASFVGSFMLSNQMRGRAIRIDKNDPNKTANIWHLVTIEPENLIKDKFNLFEENEIVNYKKEIHSCDYQVLERRFESFIGPDYETGEIVSGIDRIKIIKPPFDKKGIENINEKMEELATDRDHTRAVWEDAKVDIGKTAVATEVPKEVRVPNVSVNIFGILAFVYTITSLVFTIIFAQTFRQAATTKNFLMLAVSAILLVIGLWLSTKLIYKIISHISPQQSIKTLSKCVLKTLKDIDIIESDAHVAVKGFNNILFDITLSNASVYEQNIFNTAIKEMFSVIENPRYIIVKESKLTKYDFTRSYACPSIIGQNKEYASIFSNYLEKSMGKMKLIYTRNDDGRKLILKCRKNSYLTFNERCINKKFKVVNYE